MCISEHRIRSFTIIYTHTAKKYIRQNVAVSTLIKHNWLYVAGLKKHFYRIICIYNLERRKRKQQSVSQPKPHHTISSILCSHSFRISMCRAFFVSTKYYFIILVVFYAVSPNKSDMSLERIQLVDQAFIRVISCALSHMLMCVVHICVKRKHMSVRSQFYDDEDAF